MSTSSLRRALLATLMTFAGAALLPAASHAAVGAAAAVSFPPTVVVGQSSVPASITLTNADTGPEAANVNTVCNAGDASPPCGNPEPGIVLVAACGWPSPSGCSIGGADPGVFSISPNATGRVGTECAGIAFNVAAVDPMLGTVRFTSIGGGHVLLPGAGSRCTIDFTVAVPRCPSVDSAPALAGIQTAQRTEHTQQSGVGPFATSALGFGTSQTTVACTPPNLGPSCASVTAPATLWPPNHKYRLVSLSGGTDPDGDPVTITVTGVTQDEPLDGLGDGDTSPDAKLGTASNEVFLRAERSGTGDGRVYRIAFQGSDGNGATCTGSLAVGVPHDQGNGNPAIDSGQTVNSFGP